MAFLGLLHLRHECFCASTFGLNQETPTLQHKAQPAKLSSTQLHPNISDPPKKIAQPLLRQRSPSAGGGIRAGRPIWRRRGSGCGPRRRNPGVGVPVATGTGVPHFCARWFNQPVPWLEWLSGGMSVFWWFGFGFAPLILGEMGSQKHLDNPCCQSKPIVGKRTVQGEICPPPPDIL